MKNILLGTIVSLLLVFPFGGIVYAEEASTQGQDQAREENGEQERIQSLLQERRDTLNYGIESEVLDLLAKLKEEGTSDLVQEVGELFRTTANPRIQKGCIELFAELKDYRFAKTAFDVLENFTDLDTELLRSVSSYLGDARFHDALPVFEEMLDNTNTTIALIAVSSIGKLGDPSYGKILLAKIEDDETPKEVKVEMIRAVGYLKSPAGIEPLMRILEDTDEQASWRWAACEALGRIGDRKALPALKKAYESQDSTLRSYVVAAMRNFSGKEIEEFLIDSLRDSFWRVRVSAAESLGMMKSEAGVPILIYKARRDPENPVRLASISAIGSIGSREGFAFLGELLSDEKTPASSRTEAGRILVEKDLQHSFTIIETVIAKEWDRSNSAILGALCKALSTAEWSGLDGIYDRMLGHKDLAIRIYGLRGIRLNKFVQLRERIVPLTEKGIPEIIRKNALDTLSALDAP